MMPDSRDAAAARTDRLIALLEDFRDTPVVIVGDLMLDEFIWGRVRRISPEAPVPIVEVEDETQSPGGAANVALNVKALGGEPLAIGVVGSDDAGRRLEGLLDDHGIRSGLVVDDGRPTTVKTRILAHGQQVVRADREDRGALGSPALGEVCRQVIDALPGAASLVMSDYAKGVVTNALCDAVLPAAARADVGVYLDPKAGNSCGYGPVTLMTPNQREAESLSGVAIHDDASLRKAGRRLLERFGCPHVLITRGDEGMALVGPKGIHEIPAAAREVYDVTGAGDTVIATMAIARAAGATIEEAAGMANYAAGVVVGKVGTAGLTPPELAAAIRSSRP